MMSNTYLAARRGLARLPTLRWWCATHPGEVRRTLFAAAIVTVLAACTPFGEEGTTDSKTASPGPSQQQGDPTRPTADGGGGMTPTQAPATPMVRIDAAEGSYAIDAREATGDELGRFFDAVRSGAYKPSDPRCTWKSKESYGSSHDDCDGRQPSAAAGCTEWCDAVEYCAWAGKRLCGKIGGGVAKQSETRDPHKSQWTRACVGTRASAAVFPYGDQSQVGRCNTKEIGLQRPNAPGSLAQCSGSPTDLFDMSGNVGEWEDSCDLTVGNHGVCDIRGGSYKHPIDQTGCSADVLGDAEIPYDDVGVRCCKDL